MEDLKMKKLFYLIGAFLMLAACGKNAVPDQPVIPGDPAEEITGFKVSLTISRTEAFDDEPGTKATFKKEWADGDIVFVFFQGVAAPKYLEMKYSGATKEFIATFRNGLAVSDLGSAGTMTAVYLPYGSSCDVVSNKGHFQFDPEYYGIYYLAEQVAYTCNSGVLSGKLNLAAPELESGKYIHFDASGCDAAHAYTLYQDFVGEIVCTGVMANGTVPSQVGTPGEGVFGYKDAANGFLSFSGVLDAAVVGKNADYQFSINDETASVLYTRDAGKRTLSASNYIGIGDLKGSKWNATEYVDLGVKVDGDPVYWATKNLGATAETGEASWGNYYAWAETTGYPVTGSFKNYSCEHTFDTEPSGYELDGDYLALASDPAHAALGGLWRTPSKEDFEALASAATWEFDRAIGTVAHEYVDMGYHVGWAKYNLGASSDHEPGAFYSWGETATKDGFWSTTYVGDHVTDPATAIWGAPWRTPTRVEFNFLISGYTNYNVNFYRGEWTTDMYGISGFNGYSVMTDENPVGFGKTVLLPAAGFISGSAHKDNGSFGYYWTSMPYRVDETHHFYYRVGNNCGFDELSDSYGLSIRPVLDLGSVNAGVTFTGKNAGYTDKTLFLPAAGQVDGTQAEGQGFYVYYWSSKRTSDGNAWRCASSNYYPSIWGENTQGQMHAGLPVRPVFSLKVPPIESYSFGDTVSGSDYSGGDDPFDF